MKLLLAAAVVSAACGPGIRDAQTPNATRDFATSFANASRVGDVAAVRKMMGPHVTIGGLWFSDPACQQEFAGTGEIAGGRLDELARCLTTVKLAVSPRKDALPDVAVLTYEPGLEIEARFVDQPSGPWLSWIGYEARQDQADALPTISPDTLESLRVAGTREPAVSGLEAESQGGHYAYAWVKTCIDAEGKVTGTHVREASSVRAARVLPAAIADWAFKPFVPAGQPMPVCSMVLLGSPLAAALDHARIPFAMHTPEGRIVVAPTSLHLRKGNKVLVPDDDTKSEMAAYSPARWIGTFALCVDEAGHVGDLLMTKSTRSAAYDAKILREVARWEYEPYIDDGKPVPVCTTITFIYSQK